MNEIMMVLRDPKGFEVELAVSDDFTVSELLEEAGKLFDFEVAEGMKLQAEPLGAVLADDQTLAKQQVGSGSILTMILL